MPQKKSNIYKTNLSILAIALMAVITVASMFVYNGLINRKFKVDTTGNTYYTYHFALVAEAQDDPFWLNVWTAANKEANRMDACVEWIGHSLTEQYPLTDQLEMAIAARVDGILIQPDGSDEVKALIQKAIGSNIPVITVMTDSSGSRRQGFVGYNSYDLGQLYGQQARAAMAQSPNECHAVVLFGSDVSENTQNIVYSSIIESLEGQNITVDVLVIDNSNVFSAEEAIRELVVYPRRKQRNRLGCRGHNPDDVEFPAGYPHLPQRNQHHLRLPGGGRSQQSRRNSNPRLLRFGGNPHRGGKAHHSGDRRRGRKPRRHGQRGFADGICAL